MPVEIERKFRVIGDAWRNSVARVRKLRQAYLSRGGPFSLRVRIDGSEAATLTIKTAGKGIERHEYEYAIPVPDALELMERREGALIVKTRHLVPAGGLTWEIDVFEGDNAGLVIAEVELPAADTFVARPDWLGAEITNDRRFYNADLARTPYRLWSESRRTTAAA